MNFKNAAIDKLKSVTGLEYDVIESNIEIPPDEKMGDLAFPCFVLAKTMRKAPPVIAKGLAEKLSGSDAVIERAEAAGGYVNFFFNRAFFASETLRAAKKAGEHWGGSDEGRGKVLLLEYSSPNIAKPFHIGHLFSTAVGNSLSKIYAHLGYDVKSLNHIGDWGTQFGKLICAYKRWGDRAAIDKDPINELLKIYVKFHDEAEKNPALEDEAREYFKKLEDGDEETAALWKYFHDVSIDEYKRVYDFLGVKFDSYNGEAFYSDKMQEIVDILSEKGLLTESEGAKVVDLSDMNVPPCIILKSNGATIYATRDIAAALYRRRTYGFYKNIYVVGTPQALHFRQIFSVMERAGWTWSRDCIHVGFGLVRFGGKNLSTRHGNVVFLDSVLHESISKTREIIEKSSPDMENKDECAKKIGIGAILYTFLKNNREKDIDLNWDSMLDFDGESAPYCQYSYARGKSILRKAADTDISDFDAIDLSLLVSDEEYALIKHINAFADAVKIAADKNEPFYVNRYVTTLAKLFNKFYNTCPILKEEDSIKKARLALAEITCMLIKSALGLLGIETVERM